MQHKTNIPIDKLINSFLNNNNNKTSGYVENRGVKAKHMGLFT